MRPISCLLGLFVLFFLTMAFGAKEDLAGISRDRAPTAAAGVPSGMLVAPRESVCYLPHVANGVLNNTYYVTAININNFQSFSVDLQIDFYKDDGTPWSIALWSHDRSLPGGFVTSLNLTLQARETVHINTNYIFPLAVGWAKVSSLGSLIVSSGFSFWQTNGTLYWEAGVLPAEAGTEWAFDANVSQDDILNGANVNTAFAIANPSEYPATITAVLLPRTGGVLLSTKYFTVPPHGHASQYLTQLFSDVAFPLGSKFHGTVVFSSSVNVSVMALKGHTSPSSEVYSTLAVRPVSTLQRNVLFDTEGNNTWETAQVIKTPAEIIGTQYFGAGNNDPDWYAVNLWSGNQLYVLCLADFLGSPLDSSIAIYDPNGSFITLVDNFSSGLDDPFLKYTAQANGMHYILVNNVGSTFGLQSFYRLLVQVK